MPTDPVLSDAHRRSLSLPTGYKQIEPISSLSVNVSKIAKQLTAENQIGVKDRAMLSEVLLVLSAPDTDGVYFFLRDGQAQQTIISMQFIPKTVAIIVDEFFHIANLHVLFEINSIEWL